MPPFIPQKRLRSNHHLESAHHSKKPKITPERTLRDNQAFVRKLEEQSDDDDSSLSDIDSDEFQEIDLEAQVSSHTHTDRQNDEEDDEIEWETAISTESSESKKREPAKDLEITFNGNVEPLRHHIAKKGPSKKERYARLHTHRMHVQYLLYHNLIRNAWACSPKIQRVLREQIPPSVVQEVERWKKASSLPQDNSTRKADGQPSRKGRGKSKRNGSQRDWGQPAAKVDVGAPDLSRGDPLVRLLKVLTIYWRKRFTIVAPSLRQYGYKPLSELKVDVASWRVGPPNPEIHGELINGIEGFTRCARACEGSRDVGSQLFVALLRSVGISSRMSVSLQPLSYRFTQSEALSLSGPHASKKPQDWTERSSLPSLQDRTATQSPSPTVEIFVPSSSKQTIQKSQDLGKSKLVVDLTHGSDDTSEDLADHKEYDDDESVIDVTPQTPRKNANRTFPDLPVPTYWAEAVSPVSNEIIPVEPFLCTPAVVTKAEHLAQFEPRGKKAERAMQVFAYIVAYSEDRSAKDVTTRYLRRHLWPGLTKGSRLPTERVPVYDENGRVLMYQQDDWFERVLRGYKRKQPSAVDVREDAGDLKPAETPRKGGDEAQGETLQAYKASSEFVLQRHLKREEALRPGARVAKVFVSGKGTNLREEPVFLRRDVELCRTAESWHKEGRTIKPNETPMKMVKARAVTANRRREVQEAERAGETLMQGMYALDQTEFIIPDAIIDGVIPKNAYGNIDCFVPSMVPEGAVHVPLRNTVKVCKRLDIDYAEAVTGFEFGNRTAIPIIAGVVIAKEYQEKVMEAWVLDEEERRIKEDGKREKRALASWRKWLMGLRVLDRFNAEHIHETSNVDEVNPFTNKKHNRSSRSSDRADRLLVELAKARPLSDVSPDDGNAVLLGGGFVIEEEESSIRAEELNVQASDLQEIPSANVASISAVGNVKGDLTRQSGALEEQVTTDQQQTKSRRRGAGRRARK